MLVEWLKLLGIGAIGALASLIVSPFILYLIDIMVYALAAIIAILIKKRGANGLSELLQTFPKFTNEPVYGKDNRKPEIYPPNYIHSTRGVLVGKNNRHPKPIRDLEGKDYPKGSPNPNISDVPKQPVAAKVDKMLNVVHSVLLFYKSYYGQSTKVEKNQEITLFTWGERPI
jgi:hypothetical protein